MYLDNASNCTGFRIYGPHLSLIKIDHISEKTIYPETIKLILQRPFKRKVMYGGGEEKEWAANSRRFIPCNMAFITQTIEWVAAFLVN